VRQNIELANNGRDSLYDGYEAESQREEEAQNYTQSSKSLPQ
jgi:hypothetical protein